MHIYTGGRNNACPNQIPSHTPKVYLKFLHAHRRFGVRERIPGTPSVCVKEFLVHLRCAFSIAFSVAFTIAFSIALR